MTNINYKSNIMPSLVLLIGLLSIFNNSHAAETATGDLTVTIGNVIQVSALDDINVSPFTAITVVPALWFLWEPFCIYSNSGNQFEYTVTGDGGSFGPANSFRVSNGSFDITYRSFFFSVTNGVVETLPNTTQIFTGTSNAIDCNGTTTSWFAPAFLRTDLEAAPPFGIYIGRFFITVSPI